MIHKFDELRKGFSEEQRTRLDSEVEEMSREYVLSQIRNEVGLTQQDVADRMAISQPAYAAYEKAENMRIGTLRKIIAALGDAQPLPPVVCELEDVAPRNCGSRGLRGSGVAAEGDGDSRTCLRILRIA